MMPSRRLVPGAILHMNQNQLCSMLGSQFMRIGYQLCRTRLKSGRTDHFAQSPLLSLRAGAAGS